MSSLAPDEREVDTPDKRNTEIIRQWSILRAVASAADVTINKLADEHRVATRTIRRDLDALQAAGFPLYSEARTTGQHYWRISSKPFQKFTDTSFTVAELCAFYANRTRLAATGASPIDPDLQSALQKVGRALSPHMKAYLDKLTAIITCKPGPAPQGRGDARAETVSVETLAKATVDRRRIEMDYHSFVSRRVKKYTIEPHRLTFTNGGLYLYAFVPAYSQMRTFALQRIRKLTVLDETFKPGEVQDEPYRNSLGPYSGGRPERVEIEFLPDVAPYIEEREWHPSQQLTGRDDGSVVLRMEIAVDPALRYWVLGFGLHARVLKPSALAANILEELEGAREQYMPSIPFDAESSIPDRSGSMFLPFASPPRRRSRRTPPATRDPFSAT
jgi:predicted DNA-binding transcriptional regulator YafY